ncbi:Uncharacterised protein [Mycobacteroides abscessus subsp. abscessus]|nr:Uncharacterised protein [Mycobacteroides abscessus subsp. abscessus]
MIPRAAFGEGTTPLGPYVCGGFCGSTALNLAPALRTATALRGWT